MKSYLNDFKIKVDIPIQLYSDNKSTMSIAYNPIQHNRTKQIKIGRYFITDNLDRSLVVTIHDPIGF